MKKIIFSLLAIGSLFFISDRVYALSIVNDNANFSDVYFYSGETSSDTYISVPSNGYGGGFGFTSFLNANLYHPFYGGTGSNIWFNSGIQWSNKDWCKGSDITFEGYLVPQLEERSRQMFSSSSYWKLNLEIPEDNISNICSISSTTILSLGEQIPVLKFICSAKSGSLTRSYKFLLSQGSQQFNGSGYWGIQTGSLTYSCDISANDVINNQNQNTQNIIGSAAQNTTEIINNQNQNNQNIINNQNENKNDIINNQDKNNQQIIDNQNKNNEELKDTINDNFQNCRESKNLYNYKDLINLNSGVTVDDDGWITITDDNTNGANTFFRNYWTNNLNLKTNTNYNIFLEVKSVSGSGKIFLVSTESVSQFAQTFSYDFNDLENNNIYYKIVKTKADFSNSNAGLRTYVRFNPGESGSIKFRISVLEDTSITISSFKYEPFGEQICSNKIDETNNQLGNLNQNITDSTPPNLSGLGESAGWLPAGPVDSIINLPLSFMQNLSNSLSKQCKPIELDIPFLPGNQKMILPCMTTIYNQIPNFNTLWNWLGVVASAFILFKYLLSLYNWVDDTLSFRENTWQDWGGV